MILIGAAFPVGAYEGRDVDVLHYDIEVQIFPEEHRVNVIAFVELEALNNNIEYIDFSLNKELHIHTIKDRAGRARSYNRCDDKVTVFLDNLLYENEKTELIFEYSGVAGIKPELGSSVWGYIGPEGSYMIYESIWYPMAWGDRATAEISIKVPNGQTAISVGDLVNVENGDKYSKFTWKVDIPTRGLSFAAGKYKQKTIAVSISDGRHMFTKITCYLFPEDFYSADKYLKASKDVLDFYSSVFGSYPYPSFTVVEIPEFFMGGHGDQALIMLYSPTFKKQSSPEFLAHEIAHNWWGALVSAEGEHSLRSGEGFGIFLRPQPRESHDLKERNFWLLEGFATYSGVLYTEHEYGKERMIDSLKNKRKEYINKIKGCPDEPLLNVEEEYNDGVYHAIVYSKGALVLHMLRYVVGDPTFFEIMKTYAQEYKDESATIKDFQVICEKVSGKDLDWFFDQWISKTSLPNYAIGRAEVVKGANGYTTKITILQTDDVCKMPVEITLHTTNSKVTKKVWIGNLKEVISFVTDAQPIYVEIDKDSWILESDRSDNRHVIHYPINWTGAKLFLTGVIKRLSSWLT